MYTTKQFDKDVEELRRLIRMCDELIERQDKHTETLIQQFNGGKEGLYEIALLKGDKIHYDEEWTDVRGWLTKSEVWSWLKIVSEY